MKLLKSGLVLGLVTGLVATVLDINAAKTVEQKDTYTYQNKQVSTVTTSVSRSDREIGKILDEKIDSFEELDEDVGFTVKDGIVTLYGEVENSSLRSHVEMLASTIPGVRSIENRIQIDD